jgi:hypothetical protein
MSELPRKVKKALAKWEGGQPLGLQESRRLQDTLSRTRIRGRQKTRVNNARRVEVLSDVGQGDAPLLSKAHTGGNSDSGAPHRIGAPLFRQVQLETQGPRELGAQQNGRDGDLAIGDLAQGATVLPFHPDRVLALLRETRVVDRQDPGAHRDQRPQAGP